jgi:hypothetical protein
MKQLSKELLLLLCAVVSCGAAWAQGNVAWVKVTDYSNLSTNDTYVIAGNGAPEGTVWYSLQNSQVTSATNLPSKQKLTITDNRISSTISDEETWKLEKAGDGIYYIKSAVENYYLQNSAGNVGSQITTKSSNDKSFQWRIHYMRTNNAGTYTVTGLYNVGSERMMALYLTSNYHDWRSYLGDNYSNIKGEEVVLYRKVITSATIGAAEYATFSCPAALDFSAATGLTIYTVAVNADETEVTLTEVANKQVPANTAVVLHGPSGTYTSQVLASATPISNNHLKIAESEMSGAAGNIYVLNKREGVVGFYKLSDSGSLAAGKAYLQLTNPAPMLTMTEEETTGIQSLTSSLSQGEEDCYDLSGRRVSQPKNGLYIVNGRKVVIK